MRAAMVALVALIATGCSKEMGPPEIVAFTVDPTEGAAGSVVALHVELENFTLGGGEDHDHAEEGEEAAEEEDHDEEAGDENTGHVHVYFDSFETNPIAQMTEADADAEIPVDAEVGSHVLMARLHTLDHLVVEPEVVMEADFEVVP